MPIGDQHDFERWDRVTFARARVLREIERQQTLRDATAALGMTYGGIRSYVEDLKAITGCQDVWHLAQWWRANRSRWADWCREQGLDDTAL